MANKFEEILISGSQTDSVKKLLELRRRIVHAARLEPGDEKTAQLTKIVHQVWQFGDQAVADYTEKFDNVKLTPKQFRVPTEELKQAHEQIDPELMTSLRKAIENVTKYQTEVFIANKPIPSGVKYTPIRRVGICVPGASAPLPSTVIMTAVPAIVAGVSEIVAISPPRFNGTIHPVILGVCFELGIKEVYRIGGAQAVAAIAMGTKTIHKVDKIVGPGNEWVQMAKRLAFGLVDIDSIAGPSEVLIIANDDANPALVAADMLSQSEHNPGSAVLFTDSQDLADKVLDELGEQVQLLDRTKETEQCLKEYGGIVVLKNIDKAVEWANDFAAEHLQIQCGDKSRQIAEKIDNAGAIFIGDYSPVALGDYWAGPSHTLPTGMSAKFFSALSSNDFIKATSIIEYDKQKLTECTKDITRLAMVEGLDAHAKSVRIRKIN